MSKKNKEKPCLIEKEGSVFVVGGVYRITNYETDKVYDLTVLSRKDKWLTILLDSKELLVRANKVCNPVSESILLDNYSPVYSYHNLKLKNKNKEL